MSLTHWTSCSIAAMLLTAGSASAQVISLPTRPPVGSVSPLRPAGVGVTRLLAIGTAPIRGGNVDAARRQALQAAYAEAVSRGAGVEVGRMTLIRNVQAITDVVSSQSRGFVRAYDVVGEGIKPDASDTYEVRIQAEVALERTEGVSDRRGLKLFLEVLGNPTVLVLLPDAEIADANSASWLRIEQHDDSVEIQRSGAAAPSARPGLTALGGESQASGTARTAEAAVAQAFAGYGYQVLTSDDLESNAAISPSMLRDARRGVTTAGLAVARAIGADILLTGTMTVSAQRVTPSGVPFISATTVAAAKAIVASNNYVVDAFHRTVTKTQVSGLAAVAATMSAIADEMSGAIAWKIPGLLAASPRLTQITVDGVSLPAAEKIRAALSAVEGVESVRFRRIPTALSARVEIEIASSYVAPEPELLLHACEAGAGFALDVMSADRFSLALSPKKKSTARASTKEQQ